MITFIRRNAVAFALVGALALAAVSGALTSIALGGSTQAPTKTVTINILNGQTGPQGPAGPPGPKGDPGPAGAPGAESCPTGYTFGALLINHPGGQTQIATCLKD
jgi:hypothetical protein